MSYMENFEDFAKRINLSEEQKKEVEKYIKLILLDNLNSMKDEYNKEIDDAIDSIDLG